MPRRRSVALVTLSALLATASGLTVPAGAFAPPDSRVFINELHYDNDGTDIGEFVEVAGPAGTDLTGWRVVPYNGNGGVVYPSEATLSGTLGDDTGSGFGFATVDVPGLQNGAPDGLALVGADDQLVQFLSYEGSFTGVGGPAAGVTSTDIGVAEDGTTAVGFSLQLSGTGETYGDFTWVGPAAQTPGAANAEQVLVASGAPRPPVLSCATTLMATSGTASTSDVSVIDVDSGVAALEITSAPVDGITLDGSTAPSDVGEAATATLTVAGTTAVGTFGVEITATTLDGQVDTCAVTVVVSNPLQTTPVSAVQGSGPVSPLDGQDVQVEAVVTSLVTADDVLSGFFVQEEDTDTDGDNATSVGVYVHCGPACPAQLYGGDLVRVTGIVAELFDNTQVGAAGPSGSVTVLQTGVPLPSAAVALLPAASSTEDPATFESVEGMRVTIPTTLAVSEYFELARFGEVVLTAKERPYQFTQTSTPTVDGYQAFLADLATRRIILDDDSNDQNDATSGPLEDEPYLYPTPGLSTRSSVRGGDTVTGLTGVLEYAFAWKLRPVAGADYTFDPVNPRPAAPDPVGGRLTVASFNVLNYFATIDETSSGDIGPCGPSGTDDCRGADSETERVRQLEKIVAALAVLDADVYGLIEIQNDEGLATRQIVDALNAATAPGTYDLVETGFIGTDAIKQAFLYRPSTVTPVGAHTLLTGAEDPRFDDGSNRPALIQTFAEVATGERVTIAVNHLKSKGSACGAGDDSPQDGSGNCDGTRTAAAEALADHLATDPTGSGDPDVLVIGDLNSYSEERPITTLEAAGYVDLLERAEGPLSYGYVFDGQLGHLDHALASDGLAGQVTGAGGWKVNADEVPLLDYNDEVLDVGEASFERKSSALPLYEPDPYRSSDHDPVVVGLELRGPPPPPNAAPVADAGGPYTVRPFRTVLLDASGSSDPDGDALTFAWDLDGDGQFDDSNRARAAFRGSRPPGSYPVSVRVGDGQEMSVDTTTVQVAARGRPIPS